MNISSATCLLLLTIVMMLTKCTAKSKLSIWIDKAQTNIIIGVHVELYLIKHGDVTEIILEPEFDQAVPPLPPEIDTVNLTWEAGDELFTYWFDNLKSKNKSILYNPLLSIPESGIIPKGPKIFQISIPCTGDDKGVAHLVLGLQIMDQHGRALKGSPIKIRLKKRCIKFETTNLCKKPCQNNGRCNQFGECECPQGYHGQFCEKDMCNPKCENNGTCISPDMCLCLDGFFGKRCEKALCDRPCQNGGRCVSQPGICWCTSGFFGEACEFSYCQKPCKHGGLCIGHNKCNCKTGYSGDQCEKGGERPTRDIKKEKAAKKCDRLKRDIDKRCKVCRSKKTRIINKCTSHKPKRQKRCKKRQGELTKRCTRKRRRKGCERKKERYEKQCNDSKKDRKKKRKPGRS